MEETGDFRRRALPDRLAPTSAECAELSRRLSVIDHSLAPAPPAAIKRAVGLVKGLMASAAIGDQSVDDVLNGYAMVLAPYPKAVVEDVCRRFLDGRLGNRVYAPTPAEIAHECRLAVADSHAERRRIMLILDAEVYKTPSPGEQAKIQAEYQRYLAETTKAVDARAGGATEAGTDAGVRASALRDLEARQSLAEQAEQQVAAG